jgi:hypothetical protein
MFFYSCAVCLPGIKCQRTIQTCKEKIIILGSYHFISNNDIIKTKKDDVMTPQKQAEIIEVVKDLLLYKPDKILIEWRPGRQQMFADSLYNEYKLDRYNLGPNEIFQIGFRLAKQLGHTKLYCIDAPGKFLMDTLINTARETGQTVMLQEFDDSIRTVSTQDDSLMKKMTVKEALKYLNTPSQNQFSLVSNYVLKALELGKVGSYAGAEFTGEWYKRNIRMYSNIVRITEPVDIRLLLIVGAGHKPIIQEFFKNNPDWEVIEVNDYFTP